MRSRGQPAQVIVWVAIMVPFVFLPIVGLSMDAGYVFDSRRDLQNVADGAARAGGMQIDVPRLEGIGSHGDGLVHLDPDQAHAAARAYLLNAGIPADQVDGDIDATEDRIIVHASRQVRPTFLQMVHAPSVTVRATGRAAPCSGLQTGTCPGGG